MHGLSVHIFDMKRLILTSTNCIHRNGLNRQNWRRQRNKIAFLNIVRLYTAQRFQLNFVISWLAKVGVASKNHRDIVNVIVEKHFNPLGKMSYMVMIRAVKMKVQAFSSARRADARNSIRSEQAKRKRKWGLITFRFKKAVNGDEVPTYSTISCEKKLDVCSQTTWSLLCGMPSSMTFKICWSDHSTSGQPCSLFVPTSADYQIFSKCFWSLFPVRLQALSRVTGVIYWRWIEDASKNTMFDPYILVRFARRSAILSSFVLQQCCNLSVIQVLRCSIWWWRCYKMFANTRRPSS